MALAKGGLVPDHCLLLPIGHSGSYFELPEDAREEMSKYKTALFEMCKSLNKTVVLFERNVKSQHMQLQVVPLPIELKDSLVPTFIEHFAKLNLKYEEVPPNVDFLTVSLHNMSIYIYIYT